MSILTDVEIRRISPKRAITINGYKAIAEAQHDNDLRAIRAIYKDATDLKDLETRLAEWITAEVTP